MTTQLKTLIAQDALGDLLKELDQESDLVGYAYKEAITKIGKNWMDALGDGFKGNLVNDIPRLIARLREFEEKARLVLPIQNGGFAGKPKSYWVEKLSEEDIEVYESDAAPGNFGFTGCDADQYASFDEALLGALAANPEVALDDEDSETQPQRSTQC